MGPEIVIGLLAGLLIASVALNLALWVTRLENTKVWRQRARDAEDARKAAELRSGEQIDAMLERISTSPRLEVLPASAPPVDPGERRFISDLPYDDAAWNEFRGVESEPNA